MVYLTADSERLSIREGLITGFIGACVVAFCYLVADVIRGVPLLTPSVLGEVFLYRRSAPSQIPDMTAVAMFTGVHLIMFAAFGLALTLVAGWSRTNPVARYGLVQLFVAFIIFAWGALSFVSDTTLGLFPVPLVLGANVAAAALMAWWLWIQHPGLRRVLRSYPLGGVDETEHLRRSTSVLRVGNPHRSPTR